MNWDRLFRHRPNTDAPPGIGLVVTGFDKGGLEQVVFNLYQGFRRHGHAAFILCEKPQLAGWFAQQMPNLRHFRIFGGSEEDFLNFCLENNIRSLHYHYNTFLMERAASLGMRVFYTIHNVYTWFGDDEMAERAACLEVCSGVAAVSGFVKDYFCARSGFPAERVAVIPNGIDFSELNGETLPAAIATRSALGLPEDAIVIAQVSSINAVKHQMGMVGVMEKLVRKNPRFHLLFAGNVIEPDYLAALTQAVEKSSAKAHIHFVPFFAHRYMGAFLRQQVDIFALPTLQEGCSNAVQEAIYCRVPMVLTDVGNARDVKDVAACIVAPTAYGAVENLRPHTVVAFSRQKNAANRDALCDAFTTMGEQLEQYRAAAAAVDADFIQSLSVEQMVQRYLSLIFG